MNKKEDTIYCGSGKVMNPKWLKVTINPSKLADYIQAPKAEASNTSNDLPF